VTTSRDIGQTRLGGSDVEVTELGFGGSCLGNLYRKVSDVDAQGAVDEAWRQGGRYFDVALRPRARRAPSRCCATQASGFRGIHKIGRLLVANERAVGGDMASGFAVPAAHHRVWDFAAAGVRASIESSLDRMGMDRLDLEHERTAVFDGNARRIYRLSWDSA
jgi:D-threo-aldose 1-dehydrogenase